MTVAFLLSLLALLAYLPVGQPHLFPHLAGYEPLLIGSGIIALLEQRTRILLPDLPSGRWISILLFAAGLIMLVALPARRIEATPEGLGDSLWLVEIIPVSSELIGYWSSFDEMLEPLIRSFLYHAACFFNGRSLLAEGNNETLLFSLGLYSTLCGILQLTAIVLFLRRRPLRGQIRGFLLLFCVPATQLFAGYIEHYAFTAMSITVILLLIWSDLEKPQPFMPPLISLIASLAVLHHLLAGFMLPGLTFYLWKRNKGNHRTFLREAALCTLLALIILSIGLYSYLQLLHLSLDGSHLMHPPVLPLHKMISSMNLAKVIFILLLCSPAAIALADLLLPRSDVVAQVLAVTALTFLVQMIVWNPVIGIPADWDLLSMASFPLHLLIMRKLEGKPERIGTVALAMITLLPTLLWMHYNHRDAQEQAEKVLQNSQSVLIQLRTESEWAAIKPERKRELLLLHLVSEKQEVSDENRKHIRMLLKKARNASSDEKEYTQTTGELRQFLQQHYYDAQPTY